MAFTTARRISKFLKANGIKRLNISSGEFICHPQWWPVLTILAQNVSRVRLVSNGDWADSYDAPTVLEFLEVNPHVIMAISRDKWHTNANVNKAIYLLKESEIPFIVARESEVTDESIVPVGRSENSYSSPAYSMFARYCTKPDRKYEFLIDENGKIYKCPFGLWHYDEVENFLDGGFNERFKEFTTTYYKTLISNCSACSRVYRRSLHPSVNG